MHSSGYTTNTHSVTVSLPHSVSYILRLHLYTRYTNASLSLETGILETEASGIFFLQPPTDVLEPIIFSAVEQRWRMLIASAAEF